MDRQQAKSGQLVHQRDWPLIGEPFDKHRIPNRFPEASRDHAVDTACRILNLIRQIGLEMVPSFHAPGTDQENIADLQDRLIDLARTMESTSIEIGEDISRFFIALSLNEEESVTDIIYGLSEDERLPPECSTNPRMHTIIFGRRLCQKLLGMGNRVGLLSENTALTVARHFLGSDLYLERCFELGNHAQLHCGCETFSREIVSWNGDAHTPGTLPPLEWVAIIGFCNGLKMHFESTFTSHRSESAQRAAPQPASLRPMIDQVERLSRTCKEDPLMSGLCLTAKFYELLVSKHVHKQPAPLANHLRTLGREKRARLLRFIQQFESSPILSDYSIEEFHGYDSGS